MELAPVLRCAASLAQVVEAANGRTAWPEGDLSRPKRAFPIGLLVLVAVMIDARLAAARASGPACGAFLAELQPHVVGIPVVRMQVLTAQPFLASCVVALITYICEPQMVVPLIAEFTGGKADVCEISFFAHPA